MAKKVVSAGLVLFRIHTNQLEVLLGHNGGPFFSKKDKSAWSIPKGEFDPDQEDPLQAARREFQEEIGSQPPEGAYIDLGTVTYSSGKTVFAWGIQGDFDPKDLQSETFELEWPKGTGTIESFPELDKVAWLTRRQAGGKLVTAQLQFLDRLEQILTEQGMLAAPVAEPVQQALF